MESLSPILRQLKPRAHLLLMLSLFLFLFLFLLLPQLFMLGLRAMFAM
jgi:hypothetical protein